MQKCFAIFALVGFVALAEAGRIRREEEKYTTKYDTVNVDDILKSERLLQNYHKCLMDQGKCTPDGSELKKIIPDALQTDCNKCNEKQKTEAEKVIKYLIKNKHSMWEELEAKYDPEGIYRSKNKDLLEEVTKKP